MVCVQYNNANESVWICVRLLYQMYIWQVAGMIVFDVALFPLFGLDYLSSNVSSDSVLCCRPFYIEHPCNLLYCWHVCRNYRSSYENVSSLYYVENGVGILCWLEMLCHIINGLFIDKQFFFCLNIWIHKETLNNFYF